MVCIVLTVGAEQSWLHGFDGKTFRLHQQSFANNVSENEEVTLKPKCKSCLKTTFCALWILGRSLEDTRSPPHQPQSNSTHQLHCSWFCTCNPNCHQPRCILLNSRWGIPLKLQGPENHALQVLREDYDSSSWTLWRGHVRFPRVLWNRERWCRWRRAGKWLSPWFRSDLSHLLEKRM